MPLEPWDCNRAARPACHPFRSPTRSCGPPTPARPHGAPRSLARAPPAGDSRSQTRSRRASPQPGWQRRAPASARESRSRHQTPWRPRARARCSRCSEATRPSRCCREAPARTPPPRSATPPAGTTAAATPAAARSSCPAQEQRSRSNSPRRSDGSIGRTPDVLDGGMRVWSILSGFAVQNQRGGCHEHERTVRRGSRRVQRSLNACSRKGSRYREVQDRTLTSLQKGC